MRTFNLGAVFGGALLVLGVASAGCVADRPARNGVFNENQYVRKDFLIQGVDPNGAAAGADPGWLMRATVTETSTPNLLGSAISVFGGLQSDVNLVRFRVTQDKLQMLSMVQLSTPVNTAGNNGVVAANTISTTEPVVNAWSATNVDLKYRINLDGETTNFYEENQELDWEVRQWVKLNFAKNDFSDLAPLGFSTNDMISKCADLADASATLVTGSFIMDDGGDTNIANDYMEFTVQVALPMKFDDTTCLTAYGPMLQNALLVNRTSVTVNLKYSFMRAEAKPTYQPWAILEKDPIHTKYGPFLYTTFNRDNATGLLAANQYVGRFDPTKPIVWYFDQNFPQNYKSIFINPKNPDDPSTIKGATNAILKAAQAVEPTTTARVDFKEYNDGGIVRSYGDIRYNFLRWASDQDLQDSFAGVTMPGFDPRNGQIVNEGIEFNDFAVLSYYVQRIDAFLVSIGASPGLGNPWPMGSCTPGTTQQVVDATVLTNHNAQSTLYQKMQTLLNVPVTNAANPHQGPADWANVTNETDSDFLSAYIAIAPYELFADPAMNLFVTPEGGTGVLGPASVWKDLGTETTFQAGAAALNAGQTPFAEAAGIGGIANSVNFVNQMRQATDVHLQLDNELKFQHRNLHMDAPGSFSLETVMEQDSRVCLPTGQWETRDQWIQHIIDTYWQQVLWHEFGHSMGLEHNFMASVDQPNFTTQRDASGKIKTDSAGHNLYTMYSNSIMEYSASPARLAWTEGWGSYDKGAIAWIYANNGSGSGFLGSHAAPKGDTATVSASTRSGQADAKWPYNDPMGFCAANDPDCIPGQERRFLRCDENHLKYSPLCRQGDLGVTPSEIIANEIDNYEWTYQWRNFRNYLKVWNEAAYANSVVGTITDMRRFLSQWIFDWSPADLTTTLHRIGIVPPPNSDGNQGNGSSQLDYYNQLTQKFFTEMSKANQMVAAFDEAVIQQSAGQRPYATVYDTFYGDETQQGIIVDKYFAMQSFVGLWTSDNYDQNQAGAYISSWGDFDFDESYTSIAETAVTSMIGTQYNVYPYFIPTAVALFAQDTHSPSFLGGGKTQAKDWIGGNVFYRQEDLINHFRTIALDSCATNGATCLPSCVNYETCTYDVTDPTQVSQSPVDAHFVGPDGLNYIYMYIPSRNEWVVARQDRNITMWKLIQNYNDDLIGNHDDGSNGLYGLEYAIKYTIDSYEAYETGSLTQDTAGSSTSGG